LAPPYVQTEITVSNVNCKDLFVDTVLVAEFKNSIAEVVAAGLDGISVDHMEVELQCGSVKAQIIVTPPADGAVKLVDVVATMTEQADSGDLVNKLLPKLKALNGIDDVKTGEIVAEVTMYPTSNTPAPTPEPTAAPPTPSPTDDTLISGSKVSVPPLLPAAIIATLSLLSIQ